MNQSTNFQPPDDGWFHIAPLGTFPHPSGALQVIDAEACGAMLGTFHEEARQPNFPGLLVDFDHASHDPAQPTTAAGWIGGLEQRDDGLYARIRWSDLGHQSLTGGRYRLASPVWNRGDCDQWTAPAEDGREVVHLRPRRLDRLALTNDPNLPGLVPLSNRREKAEGKKEKGEMDLSDGVAQTSAFPDGVAQTSAFPDGVWERGKEEVRSKKVEVPTSGAAASSFNLQPSSLNTNMNLRTEFLQGLKLPGSATDGEMVAALRGQAAELETLRNRCARLAEAQADADVERFADVITNREVVRSQLLANRESTLTLLNALRPATAPAPLHQPSLRRVNPSLLSPLAAEPDSAVARRVANRARTLQSQLKIGHHAAFRLAEGEAGEPEGA